MMKRITLFLTAILLVYAACKSRKAKAVDPWSKLTQSENLIKDGIGTDDFKLGDKITDVIARLGPVHQDTTFGVYSTRIHYPQYGLSFYHMYRDVEKLVSSIEFEAPFKGHTEKGIEIGKSKMSEVIEKYGVPEWFSADNQDYWGNEYPSGIRFYVKRDMTLPQYPLDEKLHTQKTIFRISVKRPGN